MSNVLIEESHDLPLVRVGVALRTGGGDDSPELDGLANFTTELMARGAAGKTREQLDLAFDALGAHLGIHTNYDGAQLEVVALRDRVDEVMALLCNVLLQPDFPRDEADQLRRELEAQLDELREDDAHLARRVMSRRLYGEHPYGRTLTGTATTLPRLTVEAARAWHERAVRGAGVLFAFAGDLSADGASALVQKYAHALPNAETTYGGNFATPQRRKGTRITLVDKPERTQSQILFSHVAPSWRSPDFDPLQVALHALGGTFTSRLMEEVRVRRGLSYGASARLGQGRGERAVTLTVAPSLDQTAETITLVRRLYAEFVKSGVTSAELDFSRVNLRESFAFNLATPEDRLDMRLGAELAGMPAERVANFPDRVSAVTLPQANEAVSRLTPNDLEIVIVSTVDELRPKLEAAGLLRDAAVDVVPYDQD